VNIALLKELTEAHGTSGQEDAVREIVRRELSGLCELSSDTMGNLIAFKKGSGSGRKLLLAAHMDEIGFVVKYIEPAGFLRLNPVGGWDPRTLNSQRVVVRTKNGDLGGVLMPGVKPAHLLNDDEKGKGQKLEDFFVDLGLPVEDVKETVRIGDQVTMDRGLQQVGKLITSKAMDDRVAVFVMIEALRAAKSHDVDVYAVATVQEEIGLRGATAAGWSVKPDIAVALDITLANDIPGIPESEQVTKLGAGTAIKFMDSSLICHPKLFAHFRDLAEQHGIPHQIELLPRGGTDAGGIQRLHGGIPSFTLSIPTRYVHTPNETVHPGDVQASIELLARYIEDAHSRSYVYEV
jgi:endoglucanase